MATRTATGMTNATLWDRIRSFYPSFRSHTSEATADLFTARGFEQLAQTDSAAIDEFFGLSLRVYLLGVNSSHAKDTLEAAGFGEYFSQPFGGIVQKMAVNSIAPVSPAYMNLQNGRSVDPFIVRKPEIFERFWKQNFNYQSFVTISDEDQMRQIFISEYGMSEFMSGIMEGLQNGYTIQRYNNKLEALNAYLNSTERPLKDTQKVTSAIAAPGDPAEDELMGLILTVRNVVSAMDLAPQTNAYNALGFSSTQDRDRLRLLIRPGYKNAIATKLMRNTFQSDAVNLPIDVIEVPHFGGITYTDASGAKLYPVYDVFGAMVGFNTVEGAETVTVNKDAAVAVDPNAHVIGIIADKGLIFECEQSPYKVEPIRNPRGLYTNYFASSRNNTVACDALYNCVVITDN
jgi:hypothetical protein